jgi:anti-anti-sigma factor
MAACEVLKTNDAMNPRNNCHRLSVELNEHFDFREIHSFRNFSKQRFEKAVDVVIDMSRTRYIDSSGVALLLCLYNWVRAPKVNVIAINCSPAITEILNSSQCGSRVEIR